MIPRCIHRHSMTAVASVLWIPAHHRAPRESDNFFSRSNWETPWSITVTAQHPAGHPPEPYGQRQRLWRPDMTETVAADSKGNQGWQTRFGRITARAGGHLGRGGAHQRHTVGGEPGGVGQGVGLPDHHPPAGGGGLRLQLLPPAGSRARARSAPGLPSGGGARSPPSVGNTTAPPPLTGT